MDLGHSLHQAEDFSHFIYSYLFSLDVAQRQKYVALSENQTY